jgi:hypothetical protein
MPRHTRLITVAAIVTVAFVAALAFERVYHISVRTRPEQVVSPGDAIQPSRQPFDLRLVDSGGVGIPVTDWGKDYSHDRRTFRDVILDGPPFIDDAAFNRVERDWRAYVDRMLEYGNNAIVVPLFLELIDVPSLYKAESLFPARHAAVRRHFGPLFEWTTGRGMEVFVETDMLALTPPLSAYLRRLAPDARGTGIDAANPAVWAIYRAVLENLFDRVPSITGIVIRFGEGGALYSSEGWPYRSEMSVRNAASLRAMLRGLLPLFEARQKTLVLRSWTVGVGPIGRLHVDPRVYEAVLGDIDSPALVVSTKFSAGDFFSYLPLNPTLGAGRHRRLIELQAKPEFEGFGAFPDFLGDEHARALRVLRSVNPRIVGTYLLPQFGGPLRAGPRSLYPLHGFWLWTDANVFVASRLAADPEADVHMLTRQWAGERFGGERWIVDAVVNALMQTRKAVLEGFYIRPFAEREVRVPGLELPPLMWIFEWDMVGGWHSLLSIVYYASRDFVDIAIEEGDAAAGLVRRANQELRSAIARAPGGCGRNCDEALRSLEYQETLFEALAAWRQAFLSYYRWLDTGDVKAWRAWRAGRQRFDRAAADHMRRFGNDAIFPAFDFTSAANAAAAADRGAWARLVAAALVVVLIALAGIGSPLGRRWLEVPRRGVLAGVPRVIWTGAITPWRVREEQPQAGAALAVTMLSLALVAFLAGAFASFASLWLAAGASLVCGVVGFVFQSTAIGSRGRKERAGLLAFSLAPLIPGAAVLLASIAYFGPLGVWYLFWTSPPARVVVLTIVMASLLSVGCGMLAARAQDSWRDAIGATAAATGAGVLALTVLLPDWVDVLRYLDRPLNIAPATDTMQFALRTYAGVSLDVGRASWIIGTLLLAGGYTACAMGQVRGRRAERPDPAATLG